MSSNLASNLQHGSMQPPLSTQQRMADEAMSNASAGGMWLKNGQEDVLTKMWLDDALTDLAAAGLDMPFL